MTQEELKQTLKDKLKECDKDTLIDIIADVCLIYVRARVFADMSNANCMQQPLNTIQDNIQEMNVLDLFKRLPHLNDDKKVIKDWGYAPNLYHFDTKWHVSWIHCDDGFAFIDFEGETAEEVIQKAFDWCVEFKLIK